MFYTRVNELCNKRGVKITNVIAEIGMGSGNLSKWKAGGVPKGDTLSKLADYFGVSTDYLLCRTDSPVPVGDMAEPNHQLIMDLTPNEIDMVEAYRAADDRARQVVDLTLEPWKKNAFSSKAM